MKEKSLKMPFGKYKGEELWHIADSDPKYILWLTTIELDGKLKEEVVMLASELDDGCSGPDIGDGYDWWNKE